MLTAGETLIGDLEDAIERDQEVRQARMIAEAARTRLVACMTTGGRGGIDLTEAQGMLDAFRSAQALAGDAEDRVLVHHGLLTSAEADRRAARRGSSAARGGGPSRPAVPGRRRAWFAPGLSAAPVIACAVVLAVLGVALAKRSGVRLPLTRW